MIKKQHSLECNYQYDSIGSPGCICNRDEKPEYTTIEAKVLSDWEIHGSDGEGFMNYFVTRKIEIPYGDASGEGCEFTMYLHSDGIARSTTQYHGAWSGWFKTCEDAIAAIEKAKCTDQ